MNSNPYSSPYMSPEQFERLMAVLPSIVTRGPGVGAGAPGTPGSGSKLFGLGCCNMSGCASTDGLGPLSAGVYAMLAGGSPRLALAKARGIPLAPNLINVRALFPNTDTSVVPGVGADQRITQDLVIDSMVTRIENLSLTANQNIFQPLFDFFFGFSNAIEAKLSIGGAPRYTASFHYTPLSNLTDVVNGCSRWPGGWILTYNQQIQMDFNARVALPYAPIEVVVTFRTWQPVTQSFVAMTNREAIALLSSEFGIDLAQSYIDMVVAMN